MARSGEVEAPGALLHHGRRYSSRAELRRMTNRVFLNNVEHRDLRVVTRHSVDFGDGINQVLVFPTEFEELQREYPILFRRAADGDFQAVALLGNPRRQ